MFAFQIQSASYFGCLWIFIRNTIIFIHLSITKLKIAGSDKFEVRANIFTDNWNELSWAHILQFKKYALGSNACFYKLWKTLTNNILDREYFPNRSIRWKILHIFNVIKNEIITCCFINSFLRTKIDQN